MKRGKEKHVTQKATDNEVSSAMQLCRCLDGRETSPGQFLALCPAHDDRSPSLSIGQKNSRILLHRFAGCGFNKIVQALSKRGISLKGQRRWTHGYGLPKGISDEWRGKKCAAHWAYRNENGEIIGYTVRYKGGTGQKDIIPFFKKEGDKWKSGYDKKEGRSLYNLDKIATAPAKQEIWIVEGEKCADAASELGLLATTSPGGSNAASKANWRPLSGRDLIIWPDNDQPGKIYAANVINCLHEQCDPPSQIQLVEVKRLGIPEKGDIVDYIAHGKGKCEIADLPLKPANNLDDVGIIQYDPADVSAAMDKAELALLEKAPHTIFQRSNRVVRVVRSADEAGLVQVDERYFSDLLSRHVSFGQINSQGNLEPIDTPYKVSSRYLARYGHWKLKRLVGLIYAPTIRRDGSLLDRPGYDEETGIYFDDGGTKFLPVDLHPTLEDAQKALRMLRRPFADFPFVTKRRRDPKVYRDEAVALCAILTVLVRQSLQTAPLFAFNAPVAGSGKTKGADAVSIIGTGRKATTSPAARDREEERKHLFAKMLEGNPIILIDNVERPLESDILANILTAPGYYSDRILGKSESASVPTNVTFFVTGNNLSIVGDLTRRCLMCSLDPKVERPDQRSKFRYPDLEKHVLKKRRIYVHAGLTILRAYRAHLAAGGKKPDIIPYGSFEEWSDLVRAALVWVGCEDPCFTRERIEADDLTKANQSRILALWDIIYGNRPVRIAEIIEDCNEAFDAKERGDKKELGEALLEATWSTKKHLEGQKVGKWIVKIQNVIRDGRKMIKDVNSPKGRGSRWILVKAS